MQSLTEEETSLYFALLRIDILFVSYFCCIITCIAIQMMGENRMEFVLWMRINGAYQTPVVYLSYLPII